MAIILDGKALSAKIRASLKEKISALKTDGAEVGLAVVLVGEDPASKIYVRNKIKACEEVGVKSYSYTLPESVTQEAVEELVSALASDEKINGILVQLPLPKHLDGDRILSLIPPEKDVDGFSAFNTGALCLGKESLIACTPHGVMQFFKEYNIPLKGKKAVVVGRSNTVGKPMAMLLLEADATVTVCHSKTENLKEITREADVLVSAVGKAGLITADMVKEGAAIIDVGMNRDENGKLCGDVDFDAVKEKAAYITPVPGGVGPMTVTMLMYNAYLAALRGKKN